MGDATTLNSEASWQKIPQTGYTLYQSGSHLQGTFVQVLVPEKPYFDADGKRKVITYLHGFALCLPKFYQQHLVKLAAENGYYVVFPDFQNSDYPDEIDQSKLVPSRDKRHLFFWYQMAIDTIAKRQESSASKFKKQNRKADEFHRIRQAPEEPSPLKCLLIALALVVIIVVVRLVYVFSPSYSKNLVKLISTVGLSLLYSPRVWMDRAIGLTAQAWEKLGQDDPNLGNAPFDFYVFGHSLGGLLALSWPSYVQDERFRPRQVLTADPAPSTELGIPGIAIAVLKLFRSPFAQEPITIRETGADLRVPVGILHGVDDNLVTPQAWVGRSGQGSNFDAIASTQKQIYFSLSEKQDKPPLDAFHNQAVTDTTYFDDALFKNFGGVKHSPNAYNDQYVWPGLELVIRDQVAASDLLDKFPLTTIQVTDELPQKGSVLPWVLLGAGLALAGVVYWWMRAGMGSR